MARPRKPITLIRNAADANRVLEEAGFPERVFYDRSVQFYYFCDGNSTDWQFGTEIDCHINGMTPKSLLDRRDYLSKAKFNGSVEEN